MVCLKIMEGCNNEQDGLGRGGQERKGKRAKD